MEKTTMQTVMQTIVADDRDCYDDLEMPAAVVVRYDYHEIPDVDDGNPYVFEVLAIRFGADIWKLEYDARHFGYRAWCVARGIATPDDHIRDEILRIEARHGKR